jgi:CheY-like chemotaxis protein
MRILIVEDEAITAMVLADSLQRLGHTIVATAASGRQACELALTHHPDAIVMDIGLAGDIDGVAAAGMIRKEIEAPIVFASGYTSPETVERTRTIPNSTFLGKPTDPVLIHARFEELRGVAG